MKTIKLIPKDIKRFKINMPLPKDVFDVNRVFKDNGFELFIVGGAVRDFIMDKPIKDFDLVTNAMPDDVERILNDNGFRTLGTGKSFGVINVFTDNDEFEIATMREDVSQGRHPEVKLGATIETDVLRRDLTLNALFFDIENNEIVDLVGGIEDIRNKVIRTVGNATDRFNEDRLRILRAIRFGNRLGVELHEDIINAIKENSSLEGVSNERIRDEFLKSVASAKNVNRLFSMLIDLKLFSNEIFDGLIIGNYWDVFKHERDIPVLLSFIFRSNKVEDVVKKLRELTFTRDEINMVSFLMDFQRISAETAPILKKMQNNCKITDNQIKHFSILCGFHELTIRRFLRFKLSVSGEDVMKDFNVTGKELGQKIYELEVENFDKLK